MVGDYAEPPASEDTDETTIWRYLTFYQLMSILNRDALYFCRVDRYPDPFEGSRPKPQASDSDDKAELARFERKYIFGNCWHINERESAAMWDQYGDRGVAIKSSVSDLRESFSSSEMGAKLYKVNYIDYETESFDSEDKLAAHFHKRLGYQHEQELRLLFHNTPPHDGSEYEKQGGRRHGAVIRESEASEDMLVDGYFHPFDIDPLINEIRIAPGRGDDFIDLVEDETANHGCNVDIVPSVLGRQPTF